MADRFHGFIVRSPNPGEVAALQTYFPGDPLGNQDVLMLGAFAQPGDVPLGALIVRASRQGKLNLGHFLIFVRVDCRRRKIGSMLMRHLYALGLRNGADQLTLAELIHQDRAENAFLRAVGLLPERSLATYTVSIERANTTVFAPVARRFGHSHPDLNGVEFLPMQKLDRKQIAQFLSTNYSGFVDQRTEQLRQGYYDLSVSVAAVSRGQIIGGGFFRCREDSRAIFLDLVVTTAPYRRGPMALMLCGQSSVIAMALGYTECVFEADEHFDHFGVGAAKRFGAKPQWYRYRYSIGREEMVSRTADGL